MSSCCLQFWNFIATSKVLRYKTGTAPPTAVSSFYPFITVLQKVLLYNTRLKHPDLLRLLSPVRSESPLKELNNFDNKDQICADN
jgi:hypothetical protein